MSLFQALSGFWPGMLHALSMELLVTKHIPSPKETLLFMAIGVWNCKEENGANCATSQVTILVPWGRELPSFPDSATSDSNTTG